MEPVSLATNGGNAAGTAVPQRDDDYRTRILRSKINLLSFFGKYLNFFFFFSENIW